MLLPSTALLIRPVSVNSSICFVTTKSLVMEVVASMATTTCTTWMTSTRVFKKSPSEMHLTSSTVSRFMRSWLISPPTFASRFRPLHLVILESTIASRLEFMIQSLVSIRLTLEKHRPSNSSSTLLALRQVKPFAKLKENSKLNAWPLSFLKPSKLNVCAMSSMVSRSNSLRIWC